MTRPSRHLFPLLKLDSTPHKRRLNFGAYTANMSVEGNPVHRHLAFYRKRAIGGAAMIVVEPVPVHRSSMLTRGEFRCEDDSVITSLRRITDACMSMARSLSKRAGGCASSRHAPAAIYEGRRLGLAQRESSGSCAWPALPKHCARA